MEARSMVGNTGAALKRGKKRSSFPDTSVVQDALKRLGVDYVCLVGAAEGEMLKAMGRGDPTSLIGSFLVSNPHLCGKVFMAIIQAFILAAKPSPEMPEKKRGKASARHPKKTTKEG